LWLGEANTARKYKANFHFGVQLEGIHYNSKKGIHPNYFTGDRPATGWGVGLFAKIDFARKNTAFLISELTLGHISGGGEIAYYVNYPTYQVFSEYHDFDITEVRNTYSAYFNIFSSKDLSLAAGGGTLLQFQLTNSSTVTDSQSGATKPSPVPEDKFGFSPIVNVLFNVNRFGLGYQIVFLAIQLKGVEGQHLEHKLFLQARLSK
jgi:hypothetical protein